MKSTDATATSTAVEAISTEAAFGRPAPPQEPDGKLLGCFADFGDQEAFSRLVERHGPMVLRMCRRMCCGDVHAAEDLAQRVFLDLASRAAALRTRTSIAGWLYRTSWHVSTRYRRDHATREAHEQQAGVVRASEVRDGDAVPFAVVSSELSDALSRALAVLPESHRDALVLHYFAGHSVGQTAEVLGVRIGTAASWLSRGRDLLRAHLQRQGTTLSANVVEAWLGEEAARMLLRPPEHVAVQALQCNAVAAAPGAAAATASAVAASAAPVVAGINLAGGLSVSGAMAGGTAFGLSRFATTVLTAVLTLGGAGLATAAVIPGGLRAMLGGNSGSGAGSSSGSAGGLFIPSTDTSISHANSDAPARPSPFSSFDFSSGPAGSVPEPTGVAALAGAAALTLVRRRRNR